MGVLIEIPSALKQYVNNQDEVEVDGSSVEEALDSLVHNSLNSNQTCLTEMARSETLSMSI